MLHPELGDTSVETSSYQRRDRDIVLVYGKTGMGKSRWTRAFTSKLKRVIYVDPMDEYPAAKEFERVADLIRYIRSYKVFRVRSLNLLDFPLLCRAAYASGDCWFVVEESQRVLPSRGELPKEFEDVVFRGRHRGVNVLLVSQRPTTVHIAARSQWTRIITFRETEPADVDWIETQSGEELGLPELPQLAYVDVTPHGIERLELEAQEGIERLTS